MKHFINPISKEIFAFENDGSQDAFINANWLPLSAEQLIALQTPTAEQLNAAFTSSKAQMLADYKIKRDAAITRCMTLHTQLVAFGQPLDAASCLEVVTALLAVFQHATVTSAATIAAFDAAIRTQYGLAFAKATPGAKLAYAARDK